MGDDLKKRWDKRFKEYRDKVAKINWIHVDSYLAGFADGLRFTADAIEDGFGKKRKKGKQ